MYRTTVSTSHTEVYLGFGERLLYIPCINLKIVGCWPTGSPSMVLLNGKNSQCYILSLLEIFL